MWAFVLAACACGAGACERPRPLANAHPSAHALAEAVVTAFAEGDQPALRNLTLDEREFREQVWPELPAARPERNLPFSYVWGDHRQKSEQHMAQTLARSRGHALSFVSVRFSGETTRYPSYAVHRESVVTVRGADGQTREVRLFGSAIEKDGAWKVFSYIVDEG